MLRWEPVSAGTVRATMRRIAHELPLSDESRAALARLCNISTGNVIVASVVGTC